jgi:PPM family protein phosphatase
MGGASGNRLQRPATRNNKMAEEIARFEMVAATDVGRVRSHNEDSIAADPDIGVATLADGMGGYNAGEVASGIAVAMIPAEMRRLRTTLTIDRATDADIEKHVEEQARKVNLAIYNAAQKESKYAGMGTTLVFGCWHGNKVTVGHLGDSRMYRLRGENIEALTKDHSWIQEQIDKGLMTYDQARASKKKNLVTRACGIDPSVAPEVHTHGVEKGDIYMLCSDGLYDMVPDDEIHLTVTSLKSNLKLAAEQLVQQANDNGGRDNISLILVHVLRDYGGAEGFFAKFKSWFK